MVAIFPSHSRTLLPRRHLRLQGLKVVILCSTGLAAHSFACPLEGAVKFLGQMHVCGVLEDIR